MNNHLYNKITNFLLSLSYEEREGESEIKLKYRERQTLSAKMFMNGKQPRKPDLQSMP